jgi:hypothetical protein
MDFLRASMAFANAELGTVRKPGFAVKLQYRRLPRAAWTPAADVSLLKTHIMMNTSSGVGIVAGNAYADAEGR